MAISNNNAFIFLQQFFNLINYKYFPVDQILLRRVQSDIMNNPIIEFYSRLMYFNVMGPDSGQTDHVCKNERLNSHGCNSAILTVEPFIGNVCVLYRHMYKNRNNWPIVEFHPNTHRNPDSYGTILWPDILP